MINLFSRVFKRITYTVRAFRQDCRFSPKLAFYRIGDELGARLGFEKLSWSCNQKKHRWILAYLSDRLMPIVQKYREDTSEGTPNPEAPIWVCWWDGLDCAPPLVKQCVNSIYRNANNHPVNFITKDTIAQYMDIPSYMTEKVQAGNMGLAHLADYIRVSLLAEYGGLWLDATIYCARPIPDEVFSYPIYSMKSERTKSKYLSEHRWVCFCLGAYAGNPFYKFVRESLELYWSTEKKAIDYLFFDYIILLGLNEIAAGKTYDKVLPNNLRRDDLQAAMNAGVPAEKWDSIIQEDTAFYKLSWRETYVEKTADGTPTVYGKLIQMM